MQTPEPFPPAFVDPGEEPSGRPVPLARRGDGIWASGERIAPIAGLVLALSSFMGWYQGSGDGLTLSVIGWHTGALGWLVFLVGVAVLMLAALRHAGIDLPAAVPESLVVIALGSLGTIFVLIRLIDVPDEFLPAEGRGIGLWIALIAALAVIAAGLLEASEEL